MHSSIKLKANLGRCGSLGRPENKCTVEPLFMVFVALAAAPQIFHFDEYGYAPVCFRRAGSGAALCPV